MAIKKMLTMEQVKEQNDRWKPSKCPFCFAQFGAFGACFRSETFYTEMDKENGLTEEQLKYIIKVDEKLKAYSGKAVMEAPVLHCSNAADPNVIVTNEYILDEDGFPCGLVDTLGKVSEKRICPLCHNALPEKYGKYPIIFVAVMGITKSGKTVYLSQMLNNINRYLPQMNLSISGSTKELDEFVASHPIRKARTDSDMKADKLPDNTLGAVLPQPIPLTIENNETHETNTIIFYDIAGENCVDKEKMEKYGPFIQNANGFMMVIDPAQFADLFCLERPDGGIISPEKVVQTMYTAFLADDTKGQSPIPFAVSFSKNDMLQRYFQNEGYPVELLQSINYEKYGRDKRGMAHNDFQQASSTLEGILRTKDATHLAENFVNIVMNRFKNVGYFTFSALSVAPIATKDGDKTYYVLNCDPVCSRLEEPLGWLLYQLGIIPAMRANKVTVKTGFLGLGGEETKIVIESRYCEPKSESQCGGLKMQTKAKKDTRGW